MFLGGPEDDKIHWLTGLGSKDSVLLFGFPEEECTPCITGDQYLSIDADPISGKLTLLGTLERVSEATPPQGVRGWVFKVEEGGRGNCGYDFWRTEYEYNDGKFVIKPDADSHMMRTPDSDCDPTPADAGQP
jgi:hypothetical protein